MDNALTLTNDMKLVLGLVGFTMAMFLFERIRADLVALVVLVVLGVTGLIAPEEIFGGFSGNAVMSIIATMILGAGLDRTGALNRLAAWLLRRGHGVEQRLVGPSLREIGAKYAGRPDGEAYVTGKIKAGGVGVWGQVNRVFGTKSVSRTGLEHIAIRKTHQAASLFDHQIRKALGQHLGAAIPDVHWPRVRSAADALLKG